jgi:hypothetical protein
MPPATGGMADAAPSRDRAQGRRGVVMWHLNEFALAERVAMAARLRELGTQCRSMEELGQRVARSFYDSTVDDEGQRVLALSRFFKTHAYGTLPAELQCCAAEAMAPAQPWPGMRCLVLLGSAGELPDWNSSRTSRRHRAVPLASPDTVRRAPMISALTQQLGLVPEEVVNPTPELFIERSRSSPDLFYVEQALGSPIVPDQEGFVRPYGIEAVLGAGGLLRTGELFAGILFYKVPVPAQIRALAKPIALSLRAAVLEAEGRLPEWAPAM